MKASLKLTALSVALAALAGQAQAIVVNDALDGAYVETAAITGTNLRRAFNLDFVSTGVGTGVYSLNIYAYDNTGAPVWLATAFNAKDGDWSFTNIPLLKFSGGTFFGAAGSPGTGTEVGTASLTINSCDELVLSITPSAGAGGQGLSAVQNVAFRPLQRIGAPAEAASCVYRQPFTACPAGTTAFVVSGNPVARTCKINNSVTTAVRLPNNANYVIDGPTTIGSGYNTNPGSISIEPGTFISGSGASLSYLAVQAGSKLYAEGKSFAPIVFTGPTNTAGSWAGLAIAGNSTCNVRTATTPCAFEAVDALQFGGSNLTESSGILRYVQVRFAGQVVRANQELNAITLLGVGSGTTLDHVQVHAGKDDGFEFFGGSVNGRYLVATGIEDDAFDFDNGYSGKLQFLYARQFDRVDADSNGIESDNIPSGDFLGVTPRTVPQISNITLIGGVGANEGIRIRRGSGALIDRAVVVNFTGEGLNFNDAATFTVGGTVAAPGTQLNIRNSFLGNAVNFEDSASDPYLVSAWYNGQAGNAVGANPLTAGPIPTAGSPLLLGDTFGSANTDGFFEATNFKGAFGGESGNWAAGWTVDFR